MTPKMGRRRWAALLAVPLAAALAACGSSTPSDQPAGSTASGPAGSAPAGASGARIVIGQAGDAQSLDPASDTSAQAGNYDAMIFDRLLVRTDDGKFVPALATKWTQENPTTWVFDLRKDVKFSDGTGLTAADVAFSFNRQIERTMQNSVNVAPYFNKVTADGDYQVKITSKAPLGTFLNRVAAVFIVPQHAVEKMGDDAFGKNPIGSGPYTLESWTTNSDFVAKANPAYWGGAAKNAEVEYKIVPEASSRVAALVSGQIDIALGLPVESAQQLGSNPAVDVVDTPTNRVLMFGIQTTKGGPLANAKVRQAINYAVDKKALLGMMGDAASLANMDGKSLMYGKSIFGYDSSIADYPYDLDKAKKLLSEAGYDGTPIEIDAPRNQWPNDSAIAEAIGPMLDKAGIKTKINIEEWSSYRAKLVGGKATGLWMYAMGNPLGDAEYYFNIVLSSKGRGYFATPEYDKQIADQGQITDPAKRLPVVQSMTKNFIENEAPWLFLWNQVDLNAKAKSVNGLSIDLDGLIDVRELTKS